MTTTEHLRAHAAPLGALAAAAIALGLLLASGAYAEPVVERRIVQHADWREDASYAYEVPVTRNSTRWPIGTRIPMGEPAYYRTVSPGFPVEFRWAAVAEPPAEGAAEAVMTARVVAEARDGRAYWSVEHELGRARIESAGDALRLKGYVDMDALVNETERLAREMPLSDGRLNWSVETVVTYAVRAGGEESSGKSRYHIPIQVGDPRFLLPPGEALQWSARHGDASVVETSAPAGAPGVLSSLRALALLVGGAALGGAVLVAAWRDPGRGLDPATAAYRREHARHHDWITDARALDGTRLARPFADVGSLDDLVRAAADARVRILHDASTRTYYASLPTITYRYARHARR